MWHFKFRHTITALTLTCVCVFTCACVHVYFWMRRDLLRVDRELVLLGNRLHNFVTCYLASGSRCLYWSRVAHSLRRAPLFRQPKASYCNPHFLPFLMLSLAANYIFPEKRVDNKVLHSCLHFKQRFFSPIRNHSVIKSHSLLCRRLKLIWYVSYLKLSVYRFFVTEKKDMNILDDMGVSVSLYNLNARYLRYLKCTWSILPIVPL